MVNWLLALDVACAAVDITSSAGMRVARQSEKCWLCELGGADLLAVHMQFEAKLSSMEDLSCDEYRCLSARPWNVVEFL